jgi:TMEM175 potassium channel family protein
MTAPTWDDKPDSNDVEAIDREIESAAAERLNFFSDAVVAIAITLLALGLPLPHGRTNAEVWQSLRGHSVAYLAFLVSFAVIGSHWSAHHRVFRYLARLGGSLRQWNMLWLLMMVITPFATRVLTGAGGFAVRFALYASVQVVAFLCFSQMVGQMARHRLLMRSTPPQVIVSARLRAVGMLSAFAISIPVAFATHWAYLCWIAPPAVARGARVLRARRAARRHVPMSSS